MEKINPNRRYLRENALPHFFCSGCGAAQVLNFFTQASAELDLDYDNLVCVAGVGCVARIPVYLNVDMLHGIHGRTLAWATGIKLVKPETKVVIFAGDGDAASIGGNHLIHAARRNLDVTMFVVNNMTFAMTGGQVAPTTPINSKTMTTPYGNPDRPFDLCKLVEAAGATFVARTTNIKPRLAVNIMKKAIEHKGFSFVEILTQCPTYFGRKALHTGNPTKVLQWIDSITVPQTEAAKMSAEELDGKLMTGIFVDKQAPVFEGNSVFHGEE